MQLPEFKLPNDQMHLKVDNYVEYLTSDWVDITCHLECNVPYHLIDVPGIYKNTKNSQQMCIEASKDWEIIGGWQPLTSSFLE